MTSLLFVGIGYGIYVLTAIPAAKAKIVSAVTSVKQTAVEVWNKIY